MHEAVRCEAVVYAYGAHNALSGLNLSITQGEYVAVAGRNGSGKSTLARHVNALLTPQEGRVFTFGLDTSEEANVLPIRQRAGMVFQNPDNQIVASVVEEDVAFGPENLGVPSEQLRARVDGALRAVGMEAFATRAPHMLSGGQKQRIAIAGVLAMQPQMVLFDESTSMLDPMGREAVLAAMDELHAQGITVVHITHSMDEALRAQRMVVLHGGTVALDGTPQQVFTEHLDELLALGLELPPLMQLAQELRALGIDAGVGLSMEEMVEHLCQL